MSTMGKKIERMKFVFGGLGHGQWMVKVSKIKKKFKMSVTKLLQLILVNLKVLNPNSNVTKLENRQLLRNLRFFAFSGKIARPEKS